jgi:hypothetical protein
MPLLSIRTDDTFTAPVVRVRVTTLLVEHEGERELESRQYEPQGPGPLEREAVLARADLEVTFGVEEHVLQVPPAERMRVTHDAQDRFLRAGFFDGAGEIVCAVEAERDDAGRLTRLAQTMRDRPPVEIRQVFDDAQGIVETTTSFAGVVLTASRRSIDANGLVTREERTSLQGPRSVTTYEYAFNERGDWISRLATTETGVKTRTLREINYL